MIHLKTLDSWKPLEPSHCPGEFKSVVIPRLLSLQAKKKARQMHKKAFVERGCLAGTYHIYHT